MKARLFAGVRSLFHACALAAVVLTATSCGGAQGDAPVGIVVQVNERDFAISSKQHRVAPGVVVLKVSNHGPEMHELIVVRARDAHLALRSDGTTVNEEALQRVTLGVLEPGPPGGVRELRVRLTPGRYELFCNMSGHYLGGMHTSIVVR